MAGIMRRLGEKRIHTGREERQDTEYKGGALRAIGQRSEGLSVGETVGYAAKSAWLGFRRVGEGVVDAAIVPVDLMTGNVEQAKSRFMDSPIDRKQRELEEEYKPGKVAGFIGDIAGGIGQSVGYGLISAIPYAGKPMMYSSIIEQSISSAAEKTGKVGLKEIGYGVTVGAIEGTLESKLGAGVNTLKSLGSAILKKTGKNVLETAAKAGGKSMLKTVLSDTAKGFAGEFAEEAISEAVDPALLRLYNIDENAQFSLKDVAYAGLIGGLSGGMMSAGPAAINYKSAVSVGRALQESRLDGDLINRAKYTLSALEAAQTRSTGQIKGKPEGDTKETAKEWLSRTSENRKVKRLSRETKELADKIRRNIAAYEKSMADPAMAQSEPVAALLGELRGNLFLVGYAYEADVIEQVMMEADDKQRQAFVDAINEELAAQGKKHDYTLADFDANKDDIRRGLAGRLMMDELQGDTAEGGAEAPQKPAQAVKSPWDGMADNEDMSGYKATGEAENALLKAAVNQSVPRGSVQAMLDEYRKGTDLTPEEFADGWSDGVHLIGRYGLKVDESADSAYNRLPQSAREASTRIGKETAETERKAAEEKAKKKKKPAAQEGKKGTVVRGEGMNVQKLSDEQYAAYKGAEVLAEVLGTDIVIENSIEERGHTVNGYFSPKTNRIHININALRNGKNIALYTLGHEVTHYIKEWSPTKFEALADFVLDQMGVDAETAIADKLASLKRLGIVKDTMTVADANALAREELVAEGMELVLTDGKVLEELAHTDRSLWQKVKAWIQNIISKIRKYYGDLNQASKTAQVLKETVESLEEIERLFTEGVTEAGERTRTAEAGVIVDDASGTAMLSVDDIPKTEKEIDDAVNRLVAKLGVDESRARKWVEDEISLATLILRDDMVDYAHRKADRRLTAIVKNSDYKQGTLDFSNICRKRREYTRMMQRIQQAFPNRRFTAEEFATIRKIMVDEGLEVACGLCYVEDRRQNEGYIAETFQRAVEAWSKGNRDTYYDTKNNVESAYNKGQAKAMAMLEGGDYVPTIADLTTVEGMNKLQAEHKDILQAWKAFNNARGMSSARLLTNEAEYQRQILKYKKDQVKRINDLGGLRVFSFSDFEEFHLLDIIQAVQDCAAMGIKIQFYTKVPSFALLMADTKAKGNLSLIPKGDLGYEMKNGKRVLVYDPVEGIDFNDPAFKKVARGNPNIGTILVGINDEHILTAMEDDFIDYIIPFHTGQTEVVRQIKKIGKWQNYKNEQVDKPWDSGSKAKPVNIYTDVIAAAEREGDPIRNERQFVERFLKVCEERGLRPRFSRFLNTNAEGKYVYTKGYYKLLLDFKMFDKDGTYLPQEPVIPEFKADLLHELTEKYVAGEKAKTEAESPAFQRALERVEAEVVGDDEGRMYSIDEDADENLTEGWKEETVKKKELPKEVKQPDRAKAASDFVTHMLDLVKTKKRWNSNDVYNYVEEHPELNFIDRIFEGDKKAKKDLEAFLNEVDDIEVLDNFSWYMGGGYSDKNYSWGEYPYRGAVRIFKNAVKKRINAIMTEQVGGTNLGIKNGDVSLAEVKNMFNRLNSNEEIGNLAEKVFATTEKLGVNIRFVNQTFIKEVSGNVIGDMVEYKTSYFNDTAISDQRKAHTILHELIHTCTVYVMYDDSKYNVMGDINRISGKSAEYVKLRNVGKRLNRIFNEIRNDPDFKGQYGTKNSMEMVAELANEEFVGLLKKKTLWDRIVEAIAELFGFSRGNTAYDNAMQCLDYLLDNPDIAEYKAHAKEQRQNARYNGYEVFGYTTLEDGQVRYSIDETTETPDVSDSAFDDALRRAGLSHLVEDTAEAEDTETAPPPRKAPKERDPEEVRRDRIRAHETLANALMEAAQNENEFRLVRNYRQKAAELADAEVRKEDLRKKTAEVNREIDALQDKLKGVDKTKREPWVMTALTDAQKRKGELLDEMDALDEKIRAETDKLLSLASAKQLRKLIRAERSKAAAMERSAERARQREMDSKEWAKETVKKAREESEEKVKKARREATDYKQAVYKTSMEKVYKARREAADYKRAVYRTANAKADEKNQKYRDRLDEMAKQSMERREITSRKRAVQRILGTLNTMLYHPNRQKHVPEELRGLTETVLASADPKKFAVNRDHIREMSDLAAKIERLERKVARTAEEQTRLEKMKSKYEHLEDETISVKRQAEALLVAFKKYQGSVTTSAGFDQALIDKMTADVESIEEAPLKEMTLESLKAVENFYTMLKHQIDEQNNLFMQGKEARVSDFGNNATTEASDAKSLKFLSPKAMELKGMANVRQFFWKNMKPLTVFEAIGSDTFTRLFQGVLNGENVWARDIEEARKKIVETRDKYGYDKWELDKRTEVKDKDGKTVRLSLSEMMSLYAYAKRKQAMGHLEGGGFVLDPGATEMAKGKVISFADMERRLNHAERHVVDQLIIGEIASKLTAEQKSYVDEMQTYLTKLGERGNTVSRKLYGIDIFTEEFYFPIKVKSEYLESHTGRTGDPNIKNRGMTKEVTPDADNPLVLQGFDAVMVDHINSMATYHAFVLPVEDLTRVLNYKPSNAKIDEDGNWTVDESRKDYSTLKAVIEEKYGAEANHYIEQLIRDLNGGARRDAAATLLDKGITGFKRASTMASLSVLFQQPTSLIRAAAYIDPKYLFGQASIVDFANHKKLWERLCKYAPVGIIKEMGGYDTGVGARTGDYLNAKVYKTPKEKWEAFIKPERFGGDSNYRAEVFGKGAAYADEMAWIQMFEACVSEQADKLGKSQDSEEVLKAAGKRFEEVVRRTQVYDSTLTRTEYMRSKDTGMKMATAFMAEPSTVVSMVADAIMRAERGDTAFLRRTAGAVAGAVIINALASSLVYAMRDDDEEKTYGEKYVASVAMEAAEAINPLEYLPYFRDIMSIMKGYEIERTDMTLISNLFQQVELLTSSKRTVGEKVLGVSGAVSAFFGIPMTNLTRDAKGIVNTVMGGVDTERGTAKGMSAALKEEFTGIFGLFDEQTKNEYQIYQAYVSGDTAHYDRVKARYKTPQAAELALRQALRDHEPRISEAAKARLSGDLAVYESLVDQIESEGIFDRNIVIRAINNEVSELKRAAEKGELVPKDETVTDEETAESLYTASDLNAALERGDTEDFAAIMAALVQDKVSTGKTEAQAKASVKSSITAYWKKQYLSGYQDTETRKRIIALLTETGLYGSRNDVATMCEGWVRSSK